MTIWVDADACPKVIKDILYRVADRAKVQVTLVANSYLHIPVSPYLTMLQVGDGFDVADAKIIELCTPGDLVVTADIPLADGAIKKGALAVNPRGELYTADTIGPILARRNFMDTLRGGLVEEVSGPPAFTMKDRELFANQLDKYLQKRRK